MAVANKAVASRVNIELEEQGQGLLADDDATIGRSACASPIFEEFTVQPKMHPKRCPKFWARTMLDRRRWLR